MLVLSRKELESIQIAGGLLTIQVIRVNRRTGEVRIGIQAPKEMRIVRSELLNGKEKPSPLT